MTLPVLRQRNKAVVSTSLCLFFLLAVVGCSTETDQETNEFGFYETELLLKDGNVLDARRYWLNNRIKIIDWPFQTLPKKINPESGKDEQEWLHIYLDAGCQFAKFLLSTRTETKQTPPNESLSENTTRKSKDNLRTKEPTEIVTSASLDFNPTSKSSGPFPFSVKCEPSTTLPRSVSCSVDPELNLQIPYHNRARDYIDKQFGMFQSFIYVSTVLKVVTVTLDGTDQKEFTQLIKTISLDRKRMTCEYNLLKHRQ
jgi:hypothetical protein